LAQPAGDGQVLMLGFPNQNPVFEMPSIIRP